MISLPGINDIVATVIHEAFVNLTDAYLKKGSHSIELSRTIGGKYPEKYLGLGLKKILDYIGINKNEFDQICNKFTNKKLFKKKINSDDFLTDNKGNLIKLNYDNLEK